MSILQCGRFRLDLRRPVVMAILNLTTDSFSGDGLAANPGTLRARAAAALAEGAGLPDLGAESTRPGAEPVAEEVEIERIVPALHALADLPVPLSVDTLKPAVMRAALAAGADMINDVNGFRAPGAVAAVAAGNAALCVMHMQGEPRTMQAAPQYREVVGEVAAFLDERVAALEAAGVARARIVVDPGFGFGKTLEHNLALLRHLDSFTAGGLPVLAGLSRKSMLGALTGHPPTGRLPASIAAAVLAAQRGARILRVHEVAATVDARKVRAAVDTY